MRRLIAPLLSVALLFALAMGPALANVYPHSVKMPSSNPYLTEIGVFDGNGVNCAVLRGTPYMCIKNRAAAPVVAVQVVSVGAAFAPNSWIDMNYFGGPIQSGGTTVVKFGTYGSGCQKLLFVKLASGSTHPFAVDVCSAASLTIQGW